MSTANYIIICSDRTKALAEHDPLNRLLIASECAARVVDNLSLRFPLTNADVKPISNLLHEVMASMPTNFPSNLRVAFFGGADKVPYAADTLKKEDMDQITCELFGMCDELSEKFEGTDE